jgi:hypothetical protein
VDTKIDFESEPESLQWWRNIRTNPNRLQLERQREGTYSLLIAGMPGSRNPD